jgi:hypothetical protein
MKLGVHRADLLRRCPVLERVNWQVSRPFVDSQELSEEQPTAGTISKRWINEVASPEPTSTEMKPF